MERMEERMEMMEERMELMEERLETLEGQVNSLELLKLNIMYKYEFSKNMVPPL